MKQPPRQKSTRFHLSTNWRVKNLCRIWFRKLSSAFVVAQNRDFSPLKTRCNFTWIRCVAPSRCNGVNTSSNVDRSKRNWLNGVRENYFSFRFDQSDVVSEVFVLQESRWESKKRRKRLFNSHIILGVIHKLEDLHCCSFMFYWIGAKNSNKVPRRSTFGAMCWKKFVAGSLLRSKNLKLFTSRSQPMVSDYKSTTKVT